MKKENLKTLKELAIAYELACNFDYVPDYEDEKDDEFFKEWVAKHGEDRVKGACESHGSRSDEIADQLVDFILD